ncbi:MAG: nucleotidyltransferase domain-containing protein [Ignavibacteriae bacterium]|nr:MAG: nucleotidyltransferase domain-containing protein [Ignavibacteriota bacterium]
MDEQIKNIIINSLKGLEIRNIILFGSRARGDFNDNSDYDILVILADDLERKRIVEIKSLIRKRLADVNIAADILIGSDSYINNEKNQIGSIFRYAFEEGKIL